MRNDTVIRYIISFLLREDQTISNYLSDMVGYTMDPDEMEQYKVVIYPSRFFDLDVYGTPSAIPPNDPPLWHGTPLLYGENRVARLREGGPLVIYADIVASTFFLISRYEEMYYRKKRDQYNRFPGKDSYPARMGFIHRPIVDEYSDTLRSLLAKEGVDIPEIPSGFSQINLTHDIDRPYEYHGIRSFMRAWWHEGKNFFDAYKLAFRSVLSDRFWSFNRFFVWNREVSQKIPTKCKTIVFYKTPGSEPEDKPNYRVNRYPIHLLRQLAKKYDVEEALHLPLSASKDPSTIARHVHLLRHDLQKNIVESRYHYLACGEPEDMEFLARAGIRDDYSMGYADVAGFRLGTCRPVRFIMPNTLQLTELRLHPLTLMECTLVRPEYMGMNYDAALSYGIGLIEQVARHGGELNILFHNDSLAKEVHPYLSKLYRDYLRAILQCEQVRVEQPKEEDFTAVTDTK